VSISKDILSSDSNQIYLTKLAYDMKCFVGLT